MLLKHIIQNRWVQLYLSNILADIVKYLRMYLFILKLFSTFSNGGSMLVKILDCFNQAFVNWGKSSRFVIAMPVWIIWWNCRQSVPVLINNSSSMYVADTYSIQLFV